MRGVAEERRVTWKAGTLRCSPIVGSCWTARWTASSKTGMYSDGFLAKGGIADGGGV